MIKELNNSIRIFKIKIMSWEYWPMWLVYFPVSFYYLYLSIKARSFFFFSAANPSIETGGMFFESKWKIFQLMPKDLFPTTIFIDSAITSDEILVMMEKDKLQFPVIAKPDRGERGWAVKILNSKQDLITYRETVNVSFLIQAYVSYPLEFSIFYYRNPNKSNGKITSVTLKKLLSLTGDGILTIEQLIKKNDRAFLQLKTLIENGKTDMQKILALGEEFTLVPYGNHVRGAMFLDYNHIINQQFNETFDTISKSINGFYYGRFDLKCTSIEDLIMGKNISILELNGAGAEPAHIYQPGFSFFKAQSVLAKHYKMMFEAAVANQNKGIDFMSYQSIQATRLSERLYKEKVVLT